MKFVCPACSRMMRPARIGVTAIEYTDKFLLNVYKIWKADEWECPVCEKKVLLGFPSFPYAQMGSDNFDAELEKALQNQETVHFY